MKFWKRYGRFFFIAAFILVAVGIIISFAMYTNYINAYSNKENTIIATHEKDSFFSIYPRGYITDTWTRNIKNANKSNEVCRGKIFEVQIKNNIENDIIKWNMKINIHNDCYLNNGWCGIFEIHQFKNGIENMQMLDLRDYEVDRIKLDYIVDARDLLIPLHEGDYIIYYPSKENKEFPISKSKRNFVVKTGVIFYSDLKDEVNLDDVQLIYYVDKSFWQDIRIKIIVVCASIWVTAFVSYIVYICSTELNKRKMNQKDKVIKESLSVFTSFFEAKDPYTNGHSKRVAEYSMLLAEKLGLSEEECKNTYYIGLMHDCGKCYIPDSILKKPGRLTENEFHSIVDHTMRGAAMLKNFSSIPGIEDGALYHHERYDGKGYPTGKAGEDIPLIGRIICVADSFDAMNSIRCYRNELSREYIINELILNKGFQFDPRIVDCMIELIYENKILFSFEGKEKNVV